MTQLTPPVTTATGTLNKVYRKVAMPSKSAKQHRLMEAAAHGRSNKVPKGVAREFLKADSRGEEQQDDADAPEGNAQRSAPTRRKDPGAQRGSKNFINDDQHARQGFTEDSPAGQPTIDGGAPGARRGTNMKHNEPIPSLGRARKGTAPATGIDEAIEAGARDFNAQVKHRSKMIRDGRKRSNDRHK